MNFSTFPNKTEGLQKLEPGIHGISNAILDTPWPKVEKSKRQLKHLIEQQEYSSVGEF